jgi:predicted Zn-dependent protease
MTLLEREHLEALEILGHIYYLQGRPKEARIVFNGLLVLDEENEPALKHLAALSLEEGDGGGALSRLKACFALAEKDAGGPDSRLWLMRAKALNLSGQATEAGEDMAEYMRRSKAEK